MIVIGVTGGICSGKSTVARLLGQYSNTSVIDADKLGHAAYEVGTDCYHQIIAVFGDKILSECDKSIDRRALGSIVFSDKTELQKLESIVWPVIRKMIKLKLVEAENLSQDFVILEAAVMIEAGWQDLVNKLVVVEVGRDIAIERLMDRNKLSLEEAAMRVDCQMPVDQRRQCADFLIVNEGSIENLMEESSRVYFSINFMNTTPIS